MQVSVESLVKKEALCYNTLVIQKDNVRAEALLEVKWHRHADRTLCICFQTKKTVREALKRFLYH